MPVIDFEGIAADGDAEKIPDGYAGLNWDNFVALDDQFDDNFAPNSGISTVINSGEACAGNKLQGPAIFSSPDKRDDFDFNSGYFAASHSNDLALKIIAFDDGEKVAVKAITLDREQKFVSFGSKFDDIDTVKIRASGGIDADQGDLGAGRFFTVDDLFLSF